MTVLVLDIIDKHLRKKEKSCKIVSSDSKYKFEQ